MPVRKKGFVFLICKALCLCPNRCEAFPSGVFHLILRRPWEKKTPISVAQDEAGNAQAGV